MDEAVCGRSLPRRRFAPYQTNGSAYTWSRELVESGEAILIKLFRGRSTLVGHALWPALAELSPVRPEARSVSGQFSAAACHIWGFLRDEGAMTTSELQRALPSRTPLLPTSLKKGIEELEKKLVIYPQLRNGASDSGIARWELVRRGLAGAATSADNCNSLGPAGVLEAALHAAFVVDPGEAGRWFPKCITDTRTRISALLNSAKLCQVNKGGLSLVAWRELAEKIPSAA
jgi:hypothetical protein